jgi:hypothetical protein
LPDGVETAVQRPEEVDGHHGRGGVGVVVFGRGDGEHSGIVHQAVQAAEAVDRRGDDLPRGRVVGDGVVVADRQPAARLDRRRHGTGGGAVDVVDHDRRPGAGQRSRVGLAEAVPGTGDHHDLAPEGRRLLLHGARS